VSISLKEVLKEEVSANPDNFYESLRYGRVIPLTKSVFIKNDDTLDTYIYEPLYPKPRKTTSSSTIFNTILSPVQEVDEIYEKDEKDELDGYGGGSRSPKINSDENLFIVILFLHGGYAIDNTKTPVTSITRINAPLIDPRNKFDGYESLTICGAAPASQINTGIPSLIDDVYHPVVIENLDRFSLLLTEKVSEVEVPAPSLAPVPSPALSPAPSPLPSPSSKSHSSSSSSSSSSKFRHIQRRAKSVYNFKKGGGGKKHVKSKPTTDTPAITLVSSIPKSTIRSKFSKFPKIVSSIQKVSHGIKRGLYSLVKGCVKIVMDNFKVQYAVFDIEDDEYVKTQERVIQAIICMSEGGPLKINDDLFDAFSYALFGGLRRHDQQYFYENCRDAVSQAVPGSDSCIKRQYALENAYERFPCIRSIVKGGRYNASHVEKIYSYHPGNDAGVPLGVRVYKYSMVSSKNDKGGISITSETSLIDIGLDEIFAGKSPDPMLGGYYGITLSEISLIISNKIDNKYFNNRPEKKRVSIIDLSCASFYLPQAIVPEIPKNIGIGGRRGRTKVSRRNNTRRKSGRNERKGRNNSKIRNQTRKSKRTRKNMKNSRRS
jgi:hypothetical protein